MKDDRITNKGQMREEQGMEAEVQREKNFENFFLGISLGFSIDLGQIFMNFYPCTSEKDSFGDLNPETPPKQHPWMLEELKRDRWMSEEQRRE